MKKIKYKGCDISYTVYNDYDNRGKYFARAVVTIHATDVIDIPLDLDKSCSSSQLAETEMTQKAKELIDDQIKTGKLKPI